METLLQKNIIEFNNLKISSKEIIESYPEDGTQHDYDVWYDKESVLICDIIKYVMSYYPEVGEYLEDSDSEWIEECIIDSNSPREFIKAMIDGYYIDIVDIVDLDTEKLIKEYLDSKENPVE